MRRLTALHLICLALAVMLLACGGGVPKGEQVREDEGRPRDAWEAVSDRAAFGKVSVRLVRVTVTPGASEAVLEIVNEEPNVLRQYKGWGGRRTAGQARVFDEHGNRYRLVRTEPHLVPQEHYDEPLHPGKTLTDVLRFEKPIDAATTIRLELPGEAVGAPGVARLEIAFR